jgi:hypothetical protein
MTSVSPQRDETPSGASRKDSATDLLALALDQTLDGFKLIFILESLVRGARVGRESSGQQSGEQTVRCERTTKEEQRADLFSDESSDVRELRLVLGDCLQRETCEDARDKELEGRQGVAHGRDG